MNRKRVFWILIIITGITACWFLFKQYYPRSNNLIKNKVPSYFPNELLSEINIPVQSVSDNNRLANEVHRAIVSYKSQLSVKQNQDYFSQYFKNNNFETQVKDSGDSLTISGTKEKVFISVTIWKRNPAQISILYILNK